MVPTFVNLQLHILTTLLVETQDAEILEKKEALATLGLKLQVSRDIGPLETICIGWNICNSWAGVAGTLALTIALGGSVTPIYGAIVCFVMVGCSGLTMAELVSIYPTAGGQYVSSSLPFWDVVNRRKIPLDIYPEPS